MTRQNASLAGALKASESARDLKVHEMEMQVKRLKDELNARVSELTSERAAAHKRQEMLDKRHESMAKEGLAVKGELAELRAEREKLLNARRQAREALGEMAEQNTRLVNAFVEKKEETSRLRAELDQVRQDARSQAAVMKAALAAAQAEAESLRRCLKRAETSRFNAEGSARPGTDGAAQDPHGTQSGAAGLSDPPDGTARWRAERNRWDQERKRWQDDRNALLQELERIRQWASTAPSKEQPDAKPRDTSVESSQGSVHECADSAGGGESHESGQSPRRSSPPAATPHPKESPHHRGRHEQSTRKAPDTEHRGAGVAPRTPNPYMFPGSHVKSDVSSSYEQASSATTRAANKDEEVSSSQSGLGNDCSGGRSSRPRSSKPEQHKEKGNQLFRASRYEEAITEYAAGLRELSGSESQKVLRAVLHCNRAAAHQAMGAHVEALYDCEMALALQPSYRRALHRRAASLAHIGDFASAVQDLHDLRQKQGGSLSPGASGRLTEWRTHAGLQGECAYYAVLGLTQGATDRDVRVAYRRLAMRLHPDKAQSSAERVAADSVFKRVTEAYNVLCDHERRRQYDQLLARQRLRRAFSTFR
ncbi:unnamed protein product [Pedinophyceae sp. YPF-701]|nr:unnamed protein product [Pedinophyceae sp. YPF-701]